MRAPRATAASTPATTAATARRSATPRPENGLNPVRQPGSARRPWLHRGRRRRPLRARSSLGIRRVPGEVAQAGEQAFDLGRFRRWAAVESAFEEAFEPAGDVAHLGEAEGGAGAGERVGQAMEGAQG